jgi:probable rRNA maturation factor
MPEAHPIDIDIKEPLWEEAVDDIEACVTAMAQSLYQYMGLSASVIELSVVLADDAFVQDLNKQYRHKDKPTNVLSFPATEDIFEVDDFLLLGDVVISYQIIEREAVEQSKSFKAHMVHMLVHGLLHLLGYDHQEEDQAQEMEKLEIEFLKTQGYENPYI